MPTEPTHVPGLTEEERELLTKIRDSYLQAMQWPGGPEDPEEVSFVMHSYETLKALLARDATTKADCVVINEEALETLLRHGKGNLNKERFAFSLEPLEFAVAEAEAALAATRETDRE